MNDYGSMMYDSYHNEIYSNIRRCVQWKLDRARNENKCEVVFRIDYGEKGKNDEKDDVLLISPIFKEITETILFNEFRTYGFYCSKIHFRPYITDECTYHFIPIKFWTESMKNIIDNNVKKIIGSVIALIYLSIK